jgi:hypothetical protein
LLMQPPPEAVTDSILAGMFKAEVSNSSALDFQL